MVLDLVGLKTTGMDYNLYLRTFVSWNICKLDESNANMQAV